jgi:hypothetical protein
MKKFSKNFLLLSIITVVLILCITSCKDDTDCKMEIYVREYNDTNVVVPYAGILIHQGETAIPGTTDAFGKFEYTRKLEAIFIVTAVDSTLIDSSFVPPIHIYRKGEGTIRLKEGTTVKKTILIK